MRPSYARPLLRPITLTPRRLPAALCTCLTAFAAASAWADTVWLQNGDRLTGSIRSVDSGVLVLRTDYGGDIRVKTDHIRTLQSDAELVVLENGPGRQYRARLLPADDGATTVARAEDPAQSPPETVTLDALDRVSRPHDRLLDTMIKGRVDLSANHTAASGTTQSISAALTLEGRHDQWRHQLDAQYARSKDDGNVSTSNYATDYALDRFIGEQAFWQARASHKRDFVEELDRQTAYGTGPGYQFWDDALGAFSLAGLVGRVHYGYADHQSESFYAASLRWNYNHYLRGRQFEFYSKGEVSRPLDDSADYAFSGEAGLRYNVTDWMSLYVKYQRDFIRGTRRDLNETRYGTGVGVRW